VGITEPPVGSQNTKRTFSGAKKTMTVPKGLKKVSLGAGRKEGGSGNMTFHVERTLLVGDGGSGRKKEKRAKRSPLS